MAQTRTFDKNVLEADLPTPIENHEWVRNLMTQNWVEQAKDTPYACRVNNEAYWSM